MQGADKGVPLVESQQHVHVPLELSEPDVKTGHATWGEIIMNIGLWPLSKSLRQPPKPRLLHHACLLEKASNEASKLAMVFAGRCKFGVE